MNESIVAELNRSAEVISSIDPSQIIEVADAIVRSLKEGGQVIFMGNGGSSADAQHIAAEFSGRYMMERPALAGVCLSNIAPVTAIGNDYTYDIVFKRQIEAICRKGDIVVGLSTSGNSKSSKYTPKCTTIFFNIFNLCLRYRYFIGSRIYFF